MSTLDAGFRGKMREFLEDTTDEICLEGSRMCGKTTAALAKVIRSCRRHAGIWWFAGRYGDGDNDTKLKPELERVALADSNDGEDIPHWNSKERCFDFDNSSKIFSYGLKAPDVRSRYAKLRGLGVAGALLSQAEELQKDISEELRAGLRQPGFPHQLIFEANPPNEVGWMPDQFPIDNSLENRKHYAISLYDNAHNLSAEDIERLERSYPVTHAKYRTLVLGLRGVSVTGEPVYGDVFRRTLHVRALSEDPNSPLIEAIEHGKTHPTWVIGQRGYGGGLKLLGGLVGQGLFLDEFLPIVKEYSAKWFPDAMIKTCCDPPGGEKTQRRFDSAQILRDAGFNPQCRESAKAHDVRLALIERLAGYMKHRGSMGEEDFGINSDRSHWLRVTRKGIMPWEFLADGAEAGYAWDEHMISVANKELRQPKNDDWFEHGMACVENLELNFSVGVVTEKQREDRLRQERERQNSYPMSTHQTSTSWMGF
jgi:hypothetical protein